MYVPGYGYGRVEDRGKAMKGKSKIDIYYDTHKEALQWGRRNVPVKVWLPK
jgi:3D (Asp-Asp-Asp) domain-containing protein